jgi:hypothetical protein
VFQESTVAQLRRANSTQRPEDWTAAALLVLQDYWGQPQLSEEASAPYTIQAYAGVAHAAFQINRQAVVQFLSQGWLGTPESPHPPFLHPSLREVLPHLVNAARSMTPPPAKAMQMLVVEFVVIEGILRSHLGLLIGLGKIALGQSPTAESIMLEAGGRGAGQLRGIASMLDEFSALLGPLASKPELGKEVIALREFYRSLAEQDRGPNPSLGVAGTRNLIAHLDLDLVPNGDVLYGFNRFRSHGPPSPARMSLAELEDSMDGFVGLATTLVACSAFILSMAIMPDLEQTDGVG